MSDTLKTAGDKVKAAGEKAGSFWQDKVAGRVDAHGFGGAVGKSWGEIKEGANIFSKSSEGHKALAFKRIGAIGVGSVMALHALKSKDAEGNDRSGLVRLTEGVLGAGAVAGGLLVGGRA